MKRILQYRSGVAAAIHVAIHSRQEHTDDSARWERDLLRRMQAFANSGRLLRGSLLCYMYHASSGRQPTKTVYKAAASLELAHAGLLIHDDVMDQDVMRRSKPSMHKQYQEYATDHRLTEQQRFGENMAICVGDYALFSAIELMAEAGVDPKIIAIFARQLATVCVGQMQDVYSAVSPTAPSKAAIYKTMQTKTAAYSVSLPLVLGATMAGAPSGTVKKLHELGLHIGTIFQIRDDELGVFGDDQVLGKLVGSDIREGKKTLLQHYLFKKSSVQDQQMLKKIYGNSKATANDIQYVRRLATKYEIQNLLAKDIASLSLRAENCIATLKLPKNTHKELQEFLTFCGSRQG